MLVESVKGYATHERTTFEAVTEARTEAIAAEGPPRRAAAEGELGRATDRLLVVAEAYPELEASTNFSQLQTDLRETEDQIAITRRVYNDTVETYNTLIQQFPAVIVARGSSASRGASSSTPRRRPRSPRRSASPPVPHDPSSGGDPRRARRGAGVGRARGRPTAPTSPTPTSPCASPPTATCW